MTPSIGDDESVSLAIIERVADREGCRPSEFNERLADVIDPDALEDLLSPTARGTTSANPTVRFVFNGYRITVTDGDRVDVEERTD